MVWAEHYDEVRPTVASAGSEWRPSVSWSLSLRVSFRRFPGCVKSPSSFRIIILTGGIFVQVKRDFIDGVNMFCWYKKDSLFNTRQWTSKFLFYVHIRNICRARTLIWTSLTFIIIKKLRKIQVYACFMSILF